MKEIYYHSSVELIKLLNSKKISCVELATIFLDRIKIINPKLNAIVDIQPELTLKYALQADKMLAQNKRSPKSIGKLHGLPITIKDCCFVKDYKCTSGTQGWKNYTAQKNSSCVDTLIKAGAIILGVTNVPELFTAFETDNDLYGCTNNPYDLSKTPGGSSGGEASIIAAGGSPMGLGSDGGGSIRVPSHFTGIAGIKPTQGLLSRTDLHGIAHGMGWINPFATLGPMARYVEDLDLALSILAVHDIRDPFNVPIPYGNMHTVDLSSLRIAFYTDDGVATPQNEIQIAVRETAKLLEKHCLSVIEKRPDVIHESSDLLADYFFDGDEGKYYQSMLNMIGTHQPSLLQIQFLNKIKAYKKTSDDWMHTFEKIGQFKIKMHAFLEEIDIIICPPCATTAKTHGAAFKELKDFNYTMGYNITGWPAAVVRCGTDHNGLPLGVQIIGRPWQDHVVLAVAKLIEDTFGGWSPPRL